MLCYVCVCTIDAFIKSGVFLKTQHTSNNTQHNIHAHTHTYIHTYIHKYIHTYIHTYIRTYIHTYIHTYILTYLLLHTLSPPFSLQHDSGTGKSTHRRGRGREHTTRLHIGYVLMLYIRNCIRGERERGRERECVCKGVNVVLTHHN